MQGISRRQVLLFPLAAVFPSGAATVWAQSGEDESSDVLENTDNGADDSANGSDITAPTEQPPPIEEGDLLVSVTGTDLIGAATVSVIKDGTKLAGKKITDLNGNASFKLPVGEYEVRISSDVAAGMSKKVTIEKGSREKLEFEVESSL